MIIFYLLQFIHIQPIINSDKICKVTTWLVIIILYFSLYVGVFHTDYITIFIMTFGQNKERLSFHFSCSNCWLFFQICCNNVITRQKWEFNKYKTLVVSCQACASHNICLVFLSRCFQFVYVLHCAGDALMVHLHLRCRCESGGIRFLGQISDSTSSFHDLLSSSHHLTYIKVYLSLLLLTNI